MTAFPLKDVGVLPLTLAAFGLNPREKAFWAAGMKQLERLVDEFEALV